MTDFAKRLEFLFAWAQRDKSMAWKQALLEEARHPGIKDALTAKMVELAAWCKPTEEK